MGDSNLPAVLSRAVQEQQIDLSKVNLIMPTTTFGQVLGEYDKVTLEVVTVDPDPKAGDVYEISRGKYVLAKRPLEAIANALGIVWDPDRTGIIESSERKSRAQATGAMRKANGEWLPHTDAKTVDLDAIEEEQRIKQEDYAEKGKLVDWNGNRPVHEPWDKHGGEQGKLAHIEREVRKAMLSFRKFKDERAMTGARERVIRYFVALRPHYSPQQLQAPLAFPRVTLDASKMLQHPELRQAAMDRMTGAVSAIFGPGPAEKPMLQDEPRQIGPPVDEPAQIEAPAEEAEADPWDLPPETSEAPAENTPEDAARMKLDEWMGSDLLQDEAKAQIKTLLGKEGATLDELQALVARCDAYRAKLDARAKGATA